MPVYNVEMYISKCVESILRQTYTNLQIILINDGSTDKSGEVCDGYAQLDNRIEVHHTKNRGLVAARKEGLSHAQGEYIGFVDADDYIEENMFECLLKKCLKSDADFVHTGYIEDGIIKRKILGFEDSFFELYTNKEREAFLEKYILSAEDDRSISYSIWSKLYKSEVIKKSYSFLHNDWQYGEDLFSLCICILQSRRIVLSTDTLYHYVIRKNSMSNLHDTQYLMKQIELYNNFAKNIYNYNKCIYKNLEKKIGEFVANRCFTLIAKMTKGYVPQFYFENIQSIKGKKIVIYGAGNVGKDYYAQFCKYKDIQILAWVDKNWEKYHYECMEISRIEDLSKYIFDRIIIAVNDKNIAKEIKKDLFDYGLLKEKVIWDKPKRIVEII